MLTTIIHLFTPAAHNNYRAKALHLSSLSIFMLLVIFSQLLFAVLTKAMPQVLGAVSTVKADELIALTNLERDKLGLAPLEINDSLVKAAALKAGDMIAKNYWAHTSPDGNSPWDWFRQSDYTYVYAGENLARDFTDSASVVDAWLKSPTHRDNLLSSRYRDIGIAVVTAEFQGQETTLVVQLFGTQIEHGLPVVAGQISQSAEAVMAEVSAEPFWPKLSPFNLTKATSIALTLVLLLALVVDTIFITRHRIVRLSGQGLAHMVFLGILLVLLLGIQPGLIL